MRLTRKEIARGLRTARVVVALAILGVGCSDKAKPAYADCIRLQANGDIEGAWRTCNEAVGTDPNSKAGESAAKLLIEMKPSYDKAKAAREASEAKQAEQQRLADEAARATKIAQAKLNVSGRFWGFDRDGECTAKSLPPYRKSYEGGTFEEDELVAIGDGCVHLFPGRSDAQLFTVFCCPR
ncbi:MAG TPA: hypothetical protein VG963_16855 [Polyangiaceae bacterium]|nr:hypothetical protein [Polyangiaceae bacterium]